MKLINTLEKMNKKISRRNFLEKLLYFHGAISLHGRVFGSDYLQTPNESKDVLKYVLITMYESPPRWLMDSLLKPFDDNNLTTNPKIGTRFFDLSNPFEPKLEYKTVKISGINFPMIWDEPIPSTNGKNVKLSKLANNLINIRGCNMNRDGHDANNIALETPNVGQETFCGKIADAKDSLFPAISLCGAEVDKDKSVSTSFYSRKGLKPIGTENDDPNYFEQIFNIFTKKNISGLTSLDDQIKVKKIFNDESDFSQIESVQKKLKKIESINFNQMYQDYLASHKKYEKLVKKSIQRQKINGVTDIAVKGLVLPQEFKVINDEINPDDYLGAYKVDDIYIGNENIEDAFHTANMPTLANQFAILELSIKYNLSNAHMVMIDPMSGLTFKNSYEVNKVKWRRNSDKVTFYYDDTLYNSVKGKLEYLNTDAHNVGTYIGLIGWSKFYMAVMSCVTEFVTFSESFDPKRNHFNDLLIHLTSEFEREPKHNHSGSEHGWTGHTSVLLSGKIHGTHVLGNIYSNSNQDTDMFENSGTWGKGALVKEIGRTIRYVDILQSMANLIGVESPIKGFELFKVVNGKVQLNIERAKNV